MRGRSAFRKHFARHRWPIRFAAAINGPSVAYLANEPCVIRSRAACELASRKAVGEAISFPYRLIANYLFTSATTYGRGGGVGRGRGVGVGRGAIVAVGVAVAVAVAVGVGLAQPVGM